MREIDTTNQPSKVARNTGRVLSGLIILFMLFDGFIKVIKLQPVLEALAKLGLTENMVVGIGITGLVSAILYAIPKTSVLGAILLTGFLGGAIATNVHTGQPLFNWFFAGAFGVITRLGLYLRNMQLRRLVVGY